jgi:hypothetical protein
MFHSKTAAVAARTSSHLKIDDALGFEAPDVVYEMAYELQVSEETAQRLFLDVKKWLWASAECLRRAEAGAPLKMLIVSQELMWLDQAWHVFICFTHLYPKYCEDYLGRFIHHVPFTRSERDAFRAAVQTDSEGTRKIRQLELRPQLEFLIEVLGTETVRDWYLSGRKPVSVIVQ